MRVESSAPEMKSVVRGLLHMRICEMRTPGALLRLGLAFGAVFALLALSADAGDARSFWSVAVNAFALGFLPLYCLVKGADTMRFELREGTIEYLWTRPASRTQLFFGFYASSLLGIATFVGVCLLAVLCAGAWLGAIESLGQWFLFAVGSGGVALAFSAIAAALGAFTGKFIVLGLLYYGFVERLLGSVPTAANQLSAMRHLADFMSPLELGFGGLLSWGGVVELIWIAGIWAVSLGLGTTVFARRKYLVGSAG